MKIALASDHGGYLLKEEIKNHLLKNNYEICDVGTYSLTSCNYSEFALLCATKVANKECDYGIVICTTGEGVTISANKVKGIRCGLIYNLETASLIREHNDCNMMALGAKFVSKEEALKYVDIFLNTDFLKGRHEKRVQIIKDYENKN